MTEWCEMEKIDIDALTKEEATIILRKIWIEKKKMFTAMYHHKMKKDLAMSRRRTKAKH
jgi:hypothetical protein